MTGGSTPAALLEAARDMCQRSDAATAGMWPRAAALLARQAIEGAVDLYWATGPAPVLADCSMRTQLICLTEIAGPDLAGIVSSSWASLSSACHVHPYELAPTGSELLGWIDAVEKFCSTAKLLPTSGSE
jgi:hypothetical protein